MEAEHPIDVPEPWPPLGSTEYDLESYAAEIDAADVTAPEAEPVSRLPELYAAIHDPELVSLLGEVPAHLEIAPVLSAVEHLNSTVYIVSNDKTVGDPFYYEKLLLAALPDYMQAADGANLEPAAAEDLLTASLGNITSMLAQHPGKVTHYLSRALQAAAHRSDANPGLLSDALKQVAASAASSGVLPEAIGTFEAAQRAGLSVEATTSLVESFMRSPDWIRTGQVGCVKTSLRALEGGDADPALVERVYGHLQGAANGLNTSLLYNQFYKTMGLNAPKLGATSNEMLTAIDTHVRNGLPIAQAMALAASGEGVEAAAQALTDPEALVQAYFKQREGPLGHQVLPYQAERTLTQGLRDLVPLVGASYEKGDVVSEGSWVFDPAKGIWYSQGGISTLHNLGFMVHEQLSYEAGNLSERPAFVHIHPKDAGRYPEKFLFAFPSDVDLLQMADSIEHTDAPVRPIGFVVHELGITECTIPANPQILRTAAPILARVKNSLFQSYGGVYGIRACAQREGGDHVLARRFQAIINRALPPGVRLQIHPHDYDFEKRFD